jgi:predicted dienelactone hydrolase
MIPAVLFLVILITLVASVLVHKKQAFAEAAYSPALYGVPGPHPVGIADLMIDDETTDETALEMTMWYPARPGDDPAATTPYAFEMKVGDPLGAVGLARFGGQAVRDAPSLLAESPYPLVILSPGFALGAETYGWLAEHLASYGFVVIAPEHQEKIGPALEGLWQAAVTRPQDILTVLAYVDGQTGLDGALTGLVDPEMVAVIGHSYGGYTSLAAAGARIDTAGFEAHCEAAAASNEPGAWLCNVLLPHLGDMATLAGLEAVPDALWPAWADPRIDAIVPMAGDAYFFGQAGLAEIRVPVMAIGGTLDQDTPYLWGTHPTYEYASSPTRVRIALNEAEHMIFTGPCESLPWLFSFVSDQFCADPGWDRCYAHNLVNHFTTAFLLAELKQDATAAATLVPEAVDFPGMTYEAEGYR